MNRYRVLVVEDNTDMRQALQGFLEDANFRVAAADSTEAGIDLVDENDFDIALIDINLPGKSGYSMIEYLREKNKDTPLIAMTARDSLDDKLKGFELGLTDYITKPFDLKEMLARMTAQLRAHGATNATAVVETPHFKLSPETWEFYSHSKLTELTKIEFRLMHVLMLSNGLVVSTNDVVEFVWGDGPEALNPPIRIHIANLRKKIGDTQFSLIKTIPGIGYKLNDTADEK